MSFQHTDMIMRGPCELHHRYDLSHSCLQESTQRSCNGDLLHYYHIGSTFMLQPFIRRIRASLIILSRKPTETYTDPVKQPYPLLSNRPSTEERSLLRKLAHLQQRCVSQWVTVTVRPINLSRAR